MQLRLTLVQKLLFFFIALPLVELVLLIVVDRYIGLLATILLIIGTGILGTWLANWQGLSTYRRIQEELRQGRMPTDSLIDGVLILLAGVLLITPGVLTDAVGLLLLTPPTRVLFRRGLIGWFKRHFKIQAIAAGPRAAEGNVVDSYATESKTEVVDSGPRRVE
jgi:UPF0716 protein FxsA